MHFRLLSAVLVLALSGCAMAPTHDNKMGATLASVGQGNIADAITQIEQQMQGDKQNDLLLNLEKGELMHLANRYQNSQSAFAVADLQITQWEETARTAPAKLMSNIGATIVGDTSRTYEGQDYEKVMLTTRMAMNHIAMGDLDTARVDIKRTHEREAVIAQFRSEQTLAAEKGANEKGVATQSKEINGYPVETLNDPEVLALKNGYQNALSHYLAGFIYEALNEPGLAAPGYRHAIELRPGLPLLEDGLAGLDQRTSFRRKKNMTDVLFVIETGNAPTRQSKRLILPLPAGTGAIVASFVFPVIYPDPTAMTINQVALGNKMLSTALVADFNVMARRSLKDELPGIYLRATIRAAAKAVIQYQLNKQSAMAGLLGNIAAAATESPADDRMWRALPGRVFVARAFIAPGDYPLTFTDVPSEQKTLQIGGRYMVIPVRLLHGKTYFGQPTQFGQLDIVKVAPQSDPETGLPALVKKSKKRSKK